jgi:hypothetical protein
MISTPSTQGFYQRRPLYPGALTIRSAILLSGTFTCLPGYATIRIRKDIGACASGAHSVHNPLSYSVEDLALLPLHRCVGNLEVGPASTQQLRCYKNSFESLYVVCRGLRYPTCEEPPRP